MPNRFKSDLRPLISIQPRDGLLTIRIASEVFKTASYFAVSPRHRCWVSVSSPCLNWVTAHPEFSQRESSKLPGTESNLNQSLGSSSVYHSAWCQCSCLSKRIQSSTVLYFKSLSFLTKKSMKTATCKEKRRVQEWLQDTLSDNIQ